MSMKFEWSSLTGNRNYIMTGSNGNREYLSLSGGCRRSPNLECPPLLLCLIHQLPAVAVEPRNDGRQCTVTYASRGDGAWVERASAEPLHCADIDAKPNGDLAHSGS